MEGDTDPWLWECHRIYTSPETPPPLPPPHPNSPKRKKLVISPHKVTVPGLLETSGPAQCPLGRGHPHVQRWGN